MSQLLRTVTVMHILQFLHQMLNVSTLLLDDSFKPATLLTNGVAMWSMKRCDSLLHSVTFHKVVHCVATHSRCGGIFSDGIISKISPDSGSETIRRLVNI